MSPTTGTGSRSDARPGQQARFDVTSYLSLWLALLFTIPANHVFPALGAIGDPALLLTLPTAALWLATRTVPTLPAYRGPSNVRVLVLLHGWYLLLTWPLGLARPVTTLEVTGATRAAVVTVALTGLALLVMDGIVRLERLVTLLRRMVWGAGFMATVGILQFVTGEPLQPSLPGFVPNTDYLGLEDRSIFNRPAGTTMHPIEYSVMSAALFPLALHFALYSRPGGRRQAATVVCVLLGLGVPMSLSRSGILALAVALLVMLTGWSWRRRANALLVALGSVPLLWLMVPGLVGTIRGMFTWLDADPSVQARLERIPRIMQHLDEYPWFGRGNGTWSVESYFLIDNELFVTTLETGVVGLALTVVLLAAGMWVGLTVAHVPEVPEPVAHLGRAMVAGLAGIAVSLATFDAFHYRILTSVIFVFVGATAALRRLAASGDALG